MSHTFKWDQPAEEVYVTGTFDGWTKSIKLDKVGDIFTKTVDVKVPEGSSKVYYKYVVDNQWVLSNSAPREADPEGNENNYFSASDLTTSPAAAILNPITADSTTAKLAGEQPLENKEVSKEPMATPSDIPGGFPATPANELDKVFGINPLPATAGAVNPVTLAPGEAVPENVNAQGLHDNVKLDKESYENSDSVAAAVMTPPPVIDTAIPETPLDLGDFQNATLNSAAAGSTTAALAGEVPLEPKVPAVVKESQDKAGVEPEASAVAAEVEDKSKVEAELLEKVPEAPAAAEGVAGPAATEGVAATAQETLANAQQTVAATVNPVIAEVTPVVNQAVADAKPVVNQAIADAKPVVDQAVTATTEAVAAAAVATTAAATAAAANLPEGVKEALPVSVQEALPTESKEEKLETVSPEVPAEVKESIVEANKSPEAAANTEAVQEKKLVEAELLSEVKAVPAVDETKTEEKTAAADTPVVEASPVAAAAASGSNVDNTPKVTEGGNTTAVPTVSEAAPAPALTETKVETPAAAETPVEAPVAATATEAPANGSTAAAPAETKTETATEAPANGSNGSNGTSTAAPAAKTEPAPSTTTETKKKNRVSAFFGKIKNKLSDKK